MLGAVTKKVGERSGCIYPETFEIVGDAAYVTGGTATFQAFLSEKFGRTISLISCSGQTLDGSGTVLWNPTSDKLLAYNADTAGNAEEAPGDLSAKTYLCTAICK